MKLSQIENELKNLLDVDKKSWVQVYQLMSMVERDQLYAPAYSSYTAWVRHLSADARIHESVLWSRLRAGRTYQRYADRRADRHAASDANADAVEAAVITDADAETLANISPDALILADKIAGSNDDVADQLIGKVLSGDMTRKDLRQAWSTVRQDRADHGIAPCRKSRHDVSVDTPASAITAADIILSLSDPGWLQQGFCGDCGDCGDGYDCKYRKYRLWTEYSVDTGDTRHARRLDALVAETYTTDRPRYDLHIHGFEIKVSKSDLLRDHKMSEYANYVDYFWIAVPAELTDEAVSVAMPDWGILALITDPDGGNKALTIHRPAQRLAGDQRWDVITSALINML